MTPLTQLDPDRTLVSPIVDVHEDNDGYTLMANLPGVPEESVHLTLEDRTLILNAENDVSIPEGYSVIRRETPPLCYHAVFELPDRVEINAIQSTLRNGVLSVVLPKREEVKPRRLPVLAG